MSSQFIEPLTSNGFTEAEAHVYISLLRYGEATVTAIASETSIKRTTTYHILQSLSERGVVSSYRKKNTDWYRALRPNILVDRITKNSQSLQDLLPGLLQLTGSARHTPKMGFHG